MITWYTIFSFSIISAALLTAMLGIWLTAIIPLNEVPKPLQTLTFQI